MRTPVGATLMSARSAIAALTAVLASFVVAGCFQTAELPRPLEMGVREGAAFRPLHDGDSLPASLMFGALITVTPSLRAVGIDPHLPQANVELSIGGMLIGSNLGEAPRDMISDGTGYTLWDVQMVLSVALCCFVCREGILTARLVDASGARFEGTARVLLGRGTCPDPLACCPSADDCPSPLNALVCG